MTVTRSTPSISNILQTASKDFLVRTLLGSDYPGENILHNYRIFTYRITLAIVSNQEFRTQSYKQTGFDYIVFQSHGKIPEGGPTEQTSSKVLSQMQSFLNSMNDNATKNLDFVLEDLYIKSFMSGARDWATEVRLKIREPYSIDTFLNNVINGLSYKGYRNFDRSNNFVLKIDFVGYPDNSEYPEVIPYSTRYYPLCITGLQANLTQEGTQYEIKAVPMNDTAKFDDVNKLPQNLKISGNTVKEVLKSLEDALNKVGEDNKKQANLIPNRYTIQFVDVEGEEIQTSKIANAKMFDPVTDKGSKEFLKNKKSYIEPITEKNQVIVNAEDRKINLNVNGKDGILNIVDNIITDSYFVIDNIRSQFANGRDKDGNLEWWRIEAIPQPDKFDKSLNKTTKHVLIKIYPRTIHWTKVASLFLPSIVASPSDFDPIIARKYEWQYTGNNKDILNFSLNFNQLWTKIITGKLGRTTIVPGETKIVVKDQETPKAQGGAEDASQASGSEVQVGASNVTIDPNSDNSKRNNQVRSGEETNPLFSLARDINALVNNPYEQVQATVEILGDPMWLGTQFIDQGARVGKGKSNLFTTDGGIALRTVDPIVRILAYAPKDISPDGFLQGDTDGTRSLSRFSAHYTVIEVESTFTGGVFKQKLKCNRATQQDMKNLSPSSEDRFSTKQIDLSIRK